jgi:hypothetical protein
MEIEKGSGVRPRADLSWACNLSRGCRAAIKDYQSENYQEVFKEAVAQSTAKIYEKVCQKKNHLRRGVVSHHVDCSRQIGPPQNCKQPSGLVEVR